MVRSGYFAAGELVCNAWIQTCDDNPHSVWDERTSNTDPLGPGEGLSCSWTVGGMTAGTEYLANISINIDVLGDSVQEENNWMVSFVWDGSAPTNLTSIR